MKALLDTHTFLRWVAGNPLLSNPVRAVLADKANEIYLSAATTWELVIKAGNGKLVLAQEVGSFVSGQITLNQFKPLPVTLDHTYQVETLPPHHKDPFDRLLIAQAQKEELVILTRDPLFANYLVQILW